MTKPKEKSPTIGALLLRVQKLERFDDTIAEKFDMWWLAVTECQDKADALQTDFQRIRSFLDEWTKQHVDNLHKEPGRKLEERLWNLERRIRNPPTPLPITISDVKCGECRHHGGNMTWVKEGAITRVKGCPMVEANQTINFKGDRCRRFDWGKK